jgi:hypothetical protein
MADHYPGTLLVSADTDPPLQSIQASPVPVNLGPNSGHKQASAL